MKASSRASLTRLSERRELLDVGPGDEGPLAGTAEHDRAHLVVGVETPELVLELCEQGRGKRVQRWVVDRDDGDGTVQLGRDERRHTVSLFLSSDSRPRRRTRIAL